MKRQVRLERIKAIEREYQIARIAADVFSRALRDDPSLLFGKKLEPADARAFDANLEATYFIRLFAEFEEGLRDLWRSGFRRTSRPHTRDLIEQVASRCSVPSDDRDSVQAVREYRNSLIHEDSGQADPIGFASARGSLCRFLSRLPLDW